MKRKEHDFIGEMEIDDKWYYGIQTIRNVHASDVTGINLSTGAQDLLCRLATIKKAAALANHEIGQITEQMAHAISLASEEIILGQHNDQFPVDMLTGGGGIGLNMNMNEVIANRSNELLTGHKGYDAVHPNTHVNMGQSTNDVVPASIHLALYDLLQKVIKGCVDISRLFSEKSQEHINTVKLGRTCLQDALPVTFGQEFSAHAAFLQRQERELHIVAQSCLTLSLGATAVGTGVGTIPGFVPAFYKHLASITDLRVEQDENLFDAMAYADIYSRISNCLKILSSGLSKIASDFRILSSGPRGGIGELELPILLPGSSIMPGKINPVVPELLIQIYFQISGNDLAVSLAVERGDLGLNVWESLIYKCLAESCRLLERGMLIFGRDCVSGLLVHKDVCLKQAEYSTALGAVIATVFGYETGSLVARIAQEENKTIAAVSVEQGLLSEEQAKELFNPIHLTSAESSCKLVQQLKDISVKTH